MNATIGIVMLCIGVGLVLVARPRNYEDCRPFMAGVVMRHLYPALVMVILVFGAALTLTGFQ